MIECFLSLILMGNLDIESKQDLQLRDDIIKHDQGFFMH